MKDRRESIFCAAVEMKSPSLRARFLQQACGNDTDLKNQVEQLLAAHFEGGSLLDSPAKGLEAGTRSFGMKPVDTSGKYKLLEPIGNGGMGVVYMADQTEPVRRRVAVKLIKPGMDTQQVLARFDAERQALAMMDHPNIAKILDAGSLDTGLPYFVMELVKGVPITHFCDQRRMPTRERLELFLPICRAVQHAHLKGIIHRDLKPSNILVAEYDHQVIPKIIDFGIAKALNTSLTDRTVFTSFGDIIGTLDYMSPEQAKLNQLDVDTRSDIYSLGVLLYEVLTGSTPFDKQRLEASGLEEVLRIIREEAPPLPSTRIHCSSTLPALAASRNTESARLAGLVRGDVDWIVMKAMAKDRDQRYQTPDALAVDVEHHLHHEPIVARPPSVIDRSVRFVRRNKIPIALTTVAIFVFGLAAMMGLMAYLSRLERAELALGMQEVEMRHERERWARQIALPGIKRLIAQGRVVQAFREATSVKQALRQDASFQDVWKSFTKKSRLEVDPPGTKILVRDRTGVDGPWLELGSSPLNDVVLPTGQLRYRFVKPGYVTREFLSETEWRGPKSLVKDWGVPGDMVPVEGVRADDRNRLPVDLGDYLIDRYEVSNAQFREFVDAGGYEKSEYWTHLEFVLDGAKLSFQQAVEQFRDMTGKHHGPATWRHGRFPQGEDNHPVRGVSWYEAAAYAKFVGKHLPTIHHWGWCAYTEEPWNLIAMSNFSGQGPEARGEYQGIPRLDIYDVAGNVEEWCFNEDWEGRRCLRGGAWNDPGQRFLNVKVGSPWDRSETHGFRCARYLGGAEPEPPTLEPWQPRLPNFDDYEPRPLKSFAPWYQIDDPKELPLNPETIEPQSPVFDPLRYEVVRITAAYGERFDIHFIFPNDRRQRYETIVYVPTAESWFSSRFPDQETRDVTFVKALVRTGRVVCWPVRKGTYGRGHGPTEFPPAPTIQHRDLFLAQSKDLARTMEYLRERRDIDVDRIIYFGNSQGTIAAPAVLANYRGFRAAVLVDGAYPPADPTHDSAVYHPFHFTAYVKIPVLMINGRYDELFPHESLQVPFFEDLGAKAQRPIIKRHLVFESRHGQPVEHVVRETDKWLREILDRQ